MMMMVVAEEGNGGACRAVLHVKFEFVVSFARMFSFYLFPIYHRYERSCFCSIALVDVTEEEN